MAAVGPELEQFLREIAAAKADAKDLCAGLTEAQFNWKPAPKRWSIAECLVHLNVGVRHVLPAFDRSIQQASALGYTDPGPFRYGWWTRLMVRSMEPPPLFRMKTVKPLEVAPSQYGRDQVLTHFVTVRDELSERVRRAAGLDLRRARVISPLNAMIRLPLGGYFQFILAHDRRHLWQARQVRTETEFPSA